MPNALVSSGSPGVPLCTQSFELDATSFACASVSSTVVAPLIDRPVEPPITFGSGTLASVAMVPAYGFVTLDSLPQAPLSARDA